MKVRSVGTFVQVGEYAHNMALVVEIAFGAECVHLYYSENGEGSVILRDDARLVFLEWWEHQAEITQDAQSPPRLVRPPGTSEWKVTPGE